MRNTVEFKRKISVLLILAMLISGQAGLAVYVETDYDTDNDGKRDLV